MILIGAALQEVAETALEPEPSPVDFGPMSVDVHVPERVEVEPHGFTVVDAAEKLSMPTDMGAQITGRSSHMRDGVTMPGGFVDPGFEGAFALEFFNHSDKTYVLEPGEAGGRLTIFELGNGTNGYQGRHGR